MREKSLLALFICTLLIALSSVGIAQEGLIPELISFPPGTEVPVEILMGVIGRYAAIAQEYQDVVEQGGLPQSVVGFRLAASVDVPGNIAGPELSAILEGFSQIAFWVEINILARHQLYFSVDLSGSLDGIELVNTPDGGFLVARDEAIYTRLPSVENLQNMFPILDALPVDDISLDSDFLQEAILNLQEAIATSTIEYIGQELTQKGMAHVVKVTTNDGFQSIILWVLDETWELCKVEFYDPKMSDNDPGSASAIAIIKEVDLVTAELPDSAFDAELAGLAEVSFEDFVALVGLNVAAVAFVGAPVAADLSLSASNVLQGEQVVIMSDGLDAEDAESDLVAQIEYRTPNGSWTSLASAYVGEAPLGHFEAVLDSSMTELPGAYDFRVTYTDTNGTASDPMELLAALNVMPLPPEVVDVSPVDGAVDVPVSSQVTATFDKEMDQTSAQAAFTLNDASGATVAGSFGWSENTLIFTPDQGLMHGQAYSAKVLGTAMALDGSILGEDFAWGFTTVSAPLPKVSKFSPLHKAKDVSISSQVTVTFTEDMDQASVESAFSLVTNGQVVEGSFQWADKTMVFTPSQSLDYNTTYQARIAGSASSALGAGLDSDGDGVAEGSPEEDVSWEFSTEVFPVIAVRPINQMALVGDFVTVNITAEAVSRLRSFAVTVDFDPEVLSIMKVERRDFTNWRPRPKNIQDANIWQNTVIDKKQGLIVLAADSTRSDGISGSGSLATITFRASGAGDSSIELKDVTAANAQGLNMAIGLRNGTVKVQKFSLYDVNHDGVVNILDFVIIQNRRGASTDVNGDGVVDIRDMLAADGDAQASPASVPEEDGLGQNYPNPFNPETWIPYQLARDAGVVIRVYSATGRLVRTLDMGHKGAGMYSTKGGAAYWDGNNESGEPVASGVYYYNIKAGSFSATRKMVIAE